MLNAYLMKGGEQKIKILPVQNLILKDFNNGYASVIQFHEEKWLSFPILIACFD
jgi:hypothetical protein